MPPDLLHAKTIAISGRHDETLDQQVVLATIGLPAALRQVAKPHGMLITDAFRSMCGIGSDVLPVGASGNFAEAGTAVLFGLQNVPLRLGPSLQPAGDEPAISLAARLDALKDLKPIIMVAAVAGESFSAELLAQMLDCAPQRLKPALDAACAINMLCQVQHDQSAVFIFQDGLLQQSAYNAVPPGIRLKLHRRAACALAAREPSSRAEIIARHHDRADNQRQSKRWMSKAAWQAIAEGRAVVAVSRLEEALAQDTERASSAAANRSLQQLLAVQRALTDGNGSESVFAAYEETIAVSARSQSPTWNQQFRSTWLAQSCHLVKGEVRAALTIGHLLEMQLNQCRGRSESLLGRRILANRMQALALMLSGQLALASAKYNFVLDNYRTRHAALRFAYGSDQAALALAHQAWVHTIMGNCDLAGQFTRRARETCERLDHPHTTSHVLAVIAVAALSAGRYDDALATAQIGRAHAMEHDFAYWVAWSNVIIAAHAARVSPHAGIARLMTAMDDYKRTGAMQLCPMIYALISSAALNSGDNQAALRAADAGLALSAQNACSLYRPELLRARASALHGEGALGNAAGALDSAFLEARKNGALLFAQRISRDGIKLSRGQNQITWQNRYHACV
jgi:hypothetical protein